MIRIGVLGREVAEEGLAGLEVEGDEEGLWDADRGGLAQYLVGEA